MLCLKLVEHLFRIVLRHTVLRFSGGNLRHRAPLLAERDIEYIIDMLLMILNET